MINDLDESIKKLLVDGVPIDLSEIDVVFDAPDQEWSSSLARPTINCYLYHMVENHDLRQSDWEVGRAPLPRNGNGNGNSHVVQRRRLPYRVDVHFMITTWANAIEDEHRLLWRVLVALMRQGTLPTQVLQGDMVAAQEWPIPMKVAQPDQLLKNPADFWSSMESHIKPGISLVVTLPLDPDMFENIPLVLTRRVRVYDEHQRYELPPIQFGGWVYSGSGKNMKPVAGAEVLIVERGTLTISDEEGRFRFDDIPSGAYTLRATAESGQIERSIAIPGEGYDLVLEGRTDGELSSSETGTGDTTGPDSPKGGKGRRR